MRILSKYILKEYGRPFLVGIYAFVLIMIVSHLFEKLDTFTRHSAPIHTIALYLIYRVPQWLVQIMPVAILLGALFSLHTLGRSNEITAIKASGVNLWRVIAPLIFLSLIISILSLFFEESIVPVSNQKAEYLYAVKIKHHKPRKGRKKDLVLAGDERRQYVIDYYDYRNKKMYNLTINQFNKKSMLIKRIDAKRAEWEDDKWIFYDGIVREFSEKDGKEIVEESSFPRKAFNLPEKPDYFGQRKSSLEEMNFFQLKEHINILEKNALSTAREMVTLYSKISFPFTCFVCMMLGIPFGLWSAPLSKSANFALCIFFSFIYWGLISVGQSLGENRILSPLFAAWMANLLFGTIGIVLIAKTRK